MDVLWIHWRAHHSASAVAVVSDDEFMYSASPNPSCTSSPFILVIKCCQGFAPLDHISLNHLFSMDDVVAFALLLAFQVWCIINRKCSICTHVFCFFLSCRACGCWVVTYDALNDCFEKRREAETGSIKELFLHTLVVWIYTCVYIYIYFYKVQ